MQKNKNKNDDQKQNRIEPLIERNIRSLVTRRIKEEKEKPVQEKIAEAIGRFTGNIAFAYTHAIIFAIWIAWNLGWFGLTPFDPSFTALQLITAIEAIFLTTFILMSQNSLDSQADKRADLDLQISLLSEHEITRLISLIKGIAQKLEVEEAQDPEINALSEDVAPDDLMDKLEIEKQKTIKEASVRE